MTYVKSQANHPINPRKYGNTWKHIGRSCSEREAQGFLHEKSRLATLVLIRAGMGAFIQDLFCDGHSTILLDYAHLAELWQT